MSELLVLQRKLQDSASEIAEMERQLGEDPDSYVLQLGLESVVSHFAQLEAEFHELADKKSVDVCTYRLFRDANEALSLRGYTSALGEFQNSLSSLYGAIKKGPRKRTRMSPDIEGVTRLNFGYAFSGSVGVVLTMERERLLVNVGALADTIETFFSLVGAPRRDDIREIGRRLGPGPLRSVFRWANAHVLDGIGADIVWRHGEEESRVLLQRDEMRHLRDEIDATSEEKEERITMTGFLVGASIVTKRFDFAPDDMEIVDLHGEIIKGRFEDAISAKHEVRIPNARYRAKMRKFTTVRYSSEEEKTEWILLELEGNVHD